MVLNLLKPLGKKKNFPLEILFFFSAHKRRQKFFGCFISSRMWQFKICTILIPVFQNYQLFLFLSFRNGYYFFSSIQFCDGLFIMVIKQSLNFFFKMFLYYFVTDRICFWYAYPVLYVNNFFIWTLYWFLRLASYLDKRPIYGIFYEWFHVNELC